jgi:hypothetical protein
MRARLGRGFKSGTQICTPVVASTRRAALAAHQKRFVDGAIHEAAGPEILGACEELRCNPSLKGLPTSEAVMTPADCCSQIRRSTSKSESLQTPDGLSGRRATPRVDRHPHSRLWGKSPDIVDNQWDVDQTSPVSHIAVANRLRPIACTASLALTSPGRPTTIAPAHNDG